MQIIRGNTQINFLAGRKVALALSTAALIACVVALFARGLSFGIDFTGGVLVEVGYEHAAEIESVRAALQSEQITDAVVQHFGTAKDVLVRLPALGAGAGDVSPSEVSSQVMQALRKPHNETLSEDGAQGAQQCNTADGVKPCAVQMRRVEFVGPQVGDELTNQGGLAMLYALIGILIYVTYRFRWQFAVGSIIALVHDVLITVGLFSALQLEFSLAVLAAVLAVIGYSLNDTIVVFDRIRENFRKMRKSEAIEVINTSINQTLPRTLLTSLTTLIVVLSLLIFGGELIRGFAVALLIGVLVGTYSSIFVASPAVLMLGVSREDLLPVEKEGARAEP